MKAEVSRPNPNGPGRKIPTDGCSWPQNPDRRLFWPQDPDRRLFMAAKSRPTVVQGAETTGFDVAIKDFNELNNPRSGASVGIIVLEPFLPLRGLRPFTRETVGREAGLNLPRNCMYTHRWVDGPVVIDPQGELVLAVEG